MHISECQVAAQDMGCDRPKFTFVGPGGEIKAEWLDPWLGLIRLDGEDGFCMARDFFGMPITCKNLRCE